MKLAAELWSGETLPWSTSSPDVRTCSTPGLENASASGQFQKTIAAERKFNAQAKQSQAQNDCGTYFAEVEFQISV